jgi:hypothetical protein
MKNRKKKNHILSRLFSSIVLFSGIHFPKSAALSPRYTGGEKTLPEFYSTSMTTPVRQIIGCGDDFVQQ